jgi:stage II sporulation protein D
LQGPAHRDFEAERLFLGPKGVMPMGDPIRKGWACALAAALALSVTAFANPASADASWVAQGKGWGHGVGMSQYGAQGFAQNGRNYRRILGHYYRDTRIGEVKPRSVRVLLSTASLVGFTGARRACGSRVNPQRSYSFAGGRRVSLLNARGKRLRVCGGQARARGPGGVRILGHGSYRGALVAQAGGSSLMVINAVPLEAYVKGVVPNEVPASWHRQALRAQAVAARSYGIATSRGGAFDHYADTRSQVYRGRSSETGRTNRAVDDTRRQVVRHGGGVAVTYYFSTSGGKTENVEHGFSGGSPSPYLRSVDDPFDNISPVHSWRVTFSDRAMESRLSGLFRGNLRRIRVLETGGSPRIVRARVVGSQGSSVVSGATLRSRLDLRSTWVRFQRR